jgi:N-acetylmuramoyl-L-alanine amidase
MTSVVISSGHGAKVAGACGIIREHEEAVRIVNQLAIELKHCGVDVRTYEDTISTTQNENLNRLVDWHNAQGPHDLDISVHFNAFEQCSKPMGCEVWYYSAKTIAAKLSAAIAEVGFIDRGAKQTSDLFFLSHTSETAVLLEICFVDSEADCEIYQNPDNFKEICINLAEALSGGEEISPAPEPPTDDALFAATGPCSYFGGPDDEGVSDSEGLAFIQTIDQAPQLFLPSQPAGTTGLARRLNPFVHYVACRWDYAKTPKPSLLEDVALVRSPKTGIALKAFPADWGPHQATSRVADLSPGLMDDLGIETDDEVEVTFPYRED